MFNANTLGNLLLHGGIVVAVSDTTDLAPEVLLPIIPPTVARDPVAGSGAN